MKGHSKGKSLHLIMLDVASASSLAKIEQSGKPLLYLGRGQ